MRFLAITIAVTTAFALGCGSDEALFSNAGNGSGGSGAAGGSSSGGQGSGASGGAGTGGSSSGGSSSACAAAVAAQSATGVLFWTSFDDAASVTSPAVGNGSGAQIQTMPADDFVAAQSGQGIRLDADGERVGLPQVGNIDPAVGSVDFCYMPFHDHSDDANHPFFSAGFSATTPMPAFMSMRKAASNNMNALQFLVSDGNTFLEWAVLGSDYGMSANTWYRITLSWNFITDGPAQANLYLDGNQLPVSNPPSGFVNMPGTNPQAALLVGAIRMQSWHAGGIIDELVIYDHPIAP